MKKPILPTLFAASLFAVSALAVPSASAAVFQQVVNVAANDVLNMRSAPGGTVIGSIPHNGRTIISTGRQQGNWIEVSWAGEVGWVHSRYLADSPEATVRPQRPTRAVRAPARRPVVRVPGFAHTHPANECTRSIQHTHPNGNKPHNHHYSCQPSTQSMANPKFKPKAHSVVVPPIKY